MGISSLPGFFCGLKMLMVLRFQKFKRREEGKEELLNTFPLK